MELVNRRWEEISVDCLVNIFSKLDLENLITAVPFVCKSWYRASCDPICWRILDFGRLDFDPTSPFAARFLSQYSAPHFSFSGFLKLALARSRGSAVDLRFSSVSKEDLFLASKECPRLKTLAMSRIGSGDEDQLLELVERWKELEMLEMDSKPSSLPEMLKRIGLRCGNFEGLKLRGSIKKEDAAAIVDFLPKLRFLDLSSCRLGREELLAIMVGCRELKSFIVRECVGFEADDEVKRRGGGMELFDYEGSMAKDESEHVEAVDGSDELEQMFMYYDDCYMMWLY